MTTQAGTLPAEGVRAMFDRIAGFFQIGLGFAVFGLFFLAALLVFFVVRVKQPGLSQIFLQSWSETLPRRWIYDSKDPFYLPAIKLVVSLAIYFVIFLVQLAVMIVFFSISGGVFAAPSMLLIGAFSGAAILRLSHHLPKAEGYELQRLVADFLLPFGLIAGVIVWLVGSPGPDPYSWLAGQLAIYYPILLVQFAAYLGLDVAVGWLKGRGVRKSEAHEGLAPKDPHDNTRETLGSSPRGWTRIIKVRILPDRVASKGLTLSGFSFGAMVFALGFFQNDPEKSGPLVLSLLSSSILFLLAAEIADSSVRFWELFVAELLYVAAAFFLFGGFSWFIWIRFSFFGWSPIVVLALPIALYSVFLVQTVRSFIRVREIAEA